MATAIPSAAGAAPDTEAEARKARRAAARAAAIASMTPADAEEGYRPFMPSDLRSCAVALVQADGSMVDCSRRFAHLAAGPQAAGTLVAREGPDNVCACMGLRPQDFRFGKGVKEKSFWRAIPGTILCVFMHLSQVNDPDDGLRMIEVDQYKIRTDLPTPKAPAASAARGGGGGCSGGGGGVSGGSSTPTNTAHKNGKNSNSRARSASAESAGGRQHDPPRAGQRRPRPCWSGRSGLDTPLGKPRSKRAYPDKFPSKPDT